MTSAVPRLGQLPQRLARLCLRIEKNCRQKLGIAAGQRLLLAVSGGADSTALAVIFAIIAPRLNVGLCALHVDHQLRPGAAQEAMGALDLCASLRIPCQIERADVAARARAEKRGIEDAGRHARAELLAEARLATDSDFIVTGHHADDLAEDILLRLMRGAGWPALGGMAARHGHCLRPLLHEKPEDLKALLRALGVKWFNDESNQNLAFRRNRARHLLMPMLRCENPGIGDTFLRMHDLAAIDADYWNSELDKAVQIHPWLPLKSGIVLPKDLLRSLPKAGRLRLYMRALAILQQERGQARADNLLKLDDILADGKGGKLIQCGGGITANVERGAISFHLSVSAPSNAQ